jgi:hypothetical protein
MRTDINSRKSLKWLVLAALIIIAGAAAYWAIEIRPKKLESYTFFDVTAEFKVKGNMFPNNRHYVTNVVKTSKYVTDEYAVKQRMAALQQARERISQLPNVEYVKNLYARNDNYRTYQFASNAMYQLVRGYDGEQAKGYLQVETFNLAEVTDH